MDQLSHTWLEESNYSNRHKLELVTSIDDNRCHKTQSCPKQTQNLRTQSNDSKTRRNCRAPPQNQPHLHRKLRTTRGADQDTLQLIYLIVKNQAQNLCHLQVNDKSEILTKNQRLLLPLEWHLILNRSIHNLLYNNLLPSCFQLPIIQKHSFQISINILLDSSLISQLYQALNPPLQLWGSIFQFDFHWNTLTMMGLYLLCPRYVLHHLYYAQIIVFTKIFAQSNFHTDLIGYGLFLLVFEVSIFFMGYSVNYSLQLWIIYCVHLTEYLSLIYYLVKKKFSNQNCVQYLFLICETLFVVLEILTWCKLTCFSLLLLKNLFNKETTCENVEWLTKTIKEETNWQELVHINWITNITIFRHFKTAKFYKYSILYVSISIMKSKMNHNQSAHADET